VRIGTGEYDWVTEEGIQGLLPSVFDATTDAGGGFTLEGLPPGRQPVAVRAPGFATWRGETEVAEGRAARIDVELFEGVTLEGVVRAADGAALEHVVIAVGEWGKLGHRARTAAGGSFRMEDLEPGEIRVSADAGDRGRAQAVLHALAGERLVWEPVLSTGLELAGRVLAEDGAPLPDWWIQIQSVHAGSGPLEDFHHDSKPTDAQGRFCFVNLSDRDYRLEARAPGGSMFPSLVESAVRPGGGELVLRLRDASIPSVFLAGKVVGADGAPPKDAVLVPSGEFNVSPIEHADPETGDFELGPYPPGVWRLSVRTQGGLDQRFGPRELAPGERWELGTLEVGGAGSLLVRFSRAQGAPEGAPILGLEYAGAGSAAQLERDGDVARAAELPPGEYALSVGWNGFASTIHPFEVRAGEETVLDVPLGPGIARRFSIALAREDPAQRFVRLSITRADGRALFRSVLGREPGTPWERELWLAPGSYRAEARLLEGDGRSASLDFTVENSAEASPIELRFD